MATPRVALVGRPTMNPEYMLTISGGSRRSMGARQLRNTRRTPARFAWMTSSWSRVGSGIIRVPEQNTPPKSHRLVTWTITESGAVAASASSQRSIPPAGGDPGVNVIGPSFGPSDLRTGVSATRSSGAPAVVGGGGGHGFPLLFRPA